MEIRKLFHEKSPVLGVMISEFANPNLIRIFQQAGFQYAIVDDEHGYFDYAQLAAMIGVANGFAFPIIVRVPGVSRESITKVLDMGANGILVPMVSTLEQAREVVRYSKYTPVGKRGISTTRAHTNYNPPPLREYLEEANRKVFTCVQLETREGVQNAEKIMQLEGIDAVFVGPNDLAADLGIPGDVNCEEVRREIKNVAGIGEKTEKPLGIITSNRQLMHFCLENGFSIYSNGSELELLLKGAKKRVDEFYEK